MVSWSAPRPRASEAYPEVPAQLDDPIMRMLAKDPTHRWPSLPHALAAMGATMVGEEHLRARFGEEAVDRFRVRHELEVQAFEHDPALEAARAERVAAARRAQRQEGAEVVAQRVGTARGPEPDGGRDLPEQMVGGDKAAFERIEPVLDVEVSTRVQRDGVTDVLVKITTDTGLVGWGESCPGSNVESIYEVIKSTIPVGFA